MEQTQLLEWDEALLNSDGTEGSQEPVGKLRLCSGAHGPERDFWIRAGNNIIGRHENCHITLPAQSVSKKHAVIEAEADCHTIYDCGSLNKTRRRKAILKPNIRYALANGDLLLFADVACQYFILPSENNGEESMSPQKQAAWEQERGENAQLAVSRQDEDFDTDDESLLVPATQTNAVKSLVFEKTPATRRMGYGGVLAKDSDEEDNDGENTINPTGRSRGSEKSTSSRECGDLCTSVALESPNAATVIPESDDECAETSAVSAPSMHLQYNSDTEADESLGNPDSSTKPCRNATLPSKTDGTSPNGVKAVSSVQGKGLNVNKGTRAGGIVGKDLEQRSAHYHLDSDTDVDEEEDMKVNASNGGQKKGGPAPLHVDSDTDVEEEPSEGTNGDDPTSKQVNKNLGNGTAALPDKTAAEFHVDSDTDVEEDVDTTARKALPVFDLGSDTDVEEDIDAPHGIVLLGSSTGATKQDSDSDAEEDMASSRKAASPSRKPAQDSDTDVEEEPSAPAKATAQQESAQDSDTDVEEEPSAPAKATAQQESAQDSDTDVEEEPSAPAKATAQQESAQDSDTDAEEMVATTSKSAIKKKDVRVTAGTKNSAILESEPPEDDEDTDADEPTEPLVKDGSDMEADESPSTLALEATQCYLDAAGGEVQEKHSSAESGDEAEATQAFVFKSPPVKPPAFKKPLLPSPGGSALPIPVCTSSEKEDFSDDEHLAVAETQSFLRGPDVSDLDLEDEPTQAFFVGVGNRPQDPPTSTQKGAGSVTRTASTDIPIAHPTEMEKEEEEATVLAEAETQFFFSPNLAVAQGRPVRPPQDPSQDETQPIALYLDLQAGRNEPAEACTSNPIPGVTQPLLTSEGPHGEQSRIGQNAKGHSQTNKDVSAVNPIMGPVPSTVKPVIFCADSGSLLESQEAQKESVEAGQSDESTQHLSLFLSEEPTPAYSIDVSEELPPEPGLEQIGSKHTDLCATLRDAEENNKLPKSCLDGIVVKASIEQDDVSTQPLESGKVSADPTPDQENATNPSSLPQTSQASEPSDVASATVQDMPPRSEPSARAKKKQPSLTKRGRKKKAATEEEDMEATTSTPIPELAEVSAHPAQREATQLLDDQPKANEEPQPFRGRSARRASATSSVPARSKSMNEAVGENLQRLQVLPLEETEDDRVGRKGRRGKGLKRRAAIEEYEAAAEADPLTGLGQPVVCIEAGDSPAPAIKASATLNVDAPALTHIATTVVEAPHSKHLHNDDADVVTVNQIPAVENEATLSNPLTTSVKTALIHPPPTDVAATCVEPADAEEACNAGPGSSRSTATPVKQRRNGKRGENAAALPTTEQTMIPAESETRGNRNRRKAAVEVAENKEECKSEAVPVRGRGRQKKVVSSDVSEKQQDPVEAPVDSPTPTRASRARKPLAGSLTEEVLTPTTSVLGRTRRGGPVEKEGVEEEKNQPKASGKSKRTKKVPPNEVTKITELEPPAEMCTATEPTPEQSQEAKMEKRHPSSRHERRTNPSEQPPSTFLQVVTDSQAGSSVEKEKLVGSQAAALSIEQAVPNDQMEDLPVEQALTSIQTATIDRPGSAPAATRTPRKRRTGGNGEQVTNNVTSASLDAQGSRKRRTIGKEKGLMEKDEDLNQTKKSEAEAEAESETVLDTQTSKKRGTKNSAEETGGALQVSRKRGTVVAGASTTVTQPSKKEEAAGACKDRTAAETVASAEIPKNSRKRRTIEGGPEAAEEAKENSLLCKAPRKRGSTEAASEVQEVQNSSSAPRISRKRGAIKQSEEATEEVNNLSLSISSEQKIDGTHVTLINAASSSAGDENSERELEKATKAAGRQRRKRAGKDVSAENRAEQTRLSEHARQLEGLVSDLTTANVDAHSSQSEKNLESTGKEVEERQMPDTGIEKNVCKAESEESVNEKRKSISASSEEAVAPSSAVTSNTRLREADLKGGPAGRRKRQNKSEEGGQDSAEQAESTEQKIKRNNTALKEGVVANATIDEVEKRQSQGNVESAASEGVRPQKRQTAALKKARSQPEVQAETPQVRGRGSQRKNTKKTVEAQITEGEQLAATKVAEDIESLPGQEEPHSGASSRSSSRGRTQAQQTDSSQESAAPGRKCRQKSSASSDGKTEEASAPPEVETPHRKNRTPNLSHSPGVFKEHSLPKVMFTGVIDESGEQVVQRLGGLLVDSVYECTHLVTDRIRRTVKFLCAVARGIPIVTLDWLEKSGKNKGFLSPSSFLVKDREQELNFDFRLSESLQKAQRQRLFEGYEIHVTPSVKPEPEFMKDIIQCSGATFLPKMPREYKDKRVVVSCSQDLMKCKLALSASLPVTNSEFILTGILQQVTDVDNFRLEGTASGQEATKPQGGKRASASCSTPPPGATKRRR